MPRAEYRGACMWCNREVGRDGTCTVPSCLRDRQNVGTIRTQRLFGLDARIQKRGGWVNSKTSLQVIP
jgi:hypothetical protein